MRVLSLVLTLLFAPTIVDAQAQQSGWRTYSPPDMSFTIELPSPLREVTFFEGEHGATLAASQEMKGADCYAAIETTPEESRFGIIVVNGRSRILRLQKREELIEYLSWLFLANDDELQFLSAPVAVKQNGLQGKEYIYVDNVGYSALFIRGRIFDTGARIYILAFVGRDINDLRSEDADNFLHSFRLRRHFRQRKD